MNVYFLSVDAKGKMVIRNVTQFSNLVYHWYYFKIEYLQFENRGVSKGRVSFLNARKVTCSTFVLHDISP
jgi:hypothetical protein